MPLKYKNLVITPKVGLSCCFCSADQKCLVLQRIALILIWVLVVQKKLQLVSFSSANDTNTKRSDYSGQHCMSNRDGIETGKNFSFDG